METTTKDARDTLLITQCYQLLSTTNRVKWIQRVCSHMGQAHRNVKTIDELCALVKEFKTPDGNPIDLRERYGNDYSSIKGALSRLKVAE